MVPLLLSTHIFQMPAATLYLASVPMRPDFYPLCLFLVYLTSLYYY